MCPACLTSAVVIVAGSGLSGGLVVVLARSARRIAGAKGSPGRVDPDMPRGLDGPALVATERVGSQRD